MSGVDLYLTVAVGNSRSTTHVTTPKNVPRQVVTDLVTELKSIAEQRLNGTEGEDTDLDPVLDDGQAG